MSETKKIYGIDLGTTYSAIAFVDEHAKPRIIPNSENDRITASVVFYDEDKTTIIVGDTAKEAGKGDEKRVVAFVKRQIPDKDWVFTVDDASYKPEEISAYILRRLVGDANKNSEYEHDVKDVVITCPAFFNDNERARTRMAGELAGLNVVAIIDEPVAAAINYGLNVKDAKGKNVLVYDLGGGTFDATVVQIGKDADSNNIAVICTDGNHQRGGKDWDDRIVGYYLEEFASQTGSNADLLADDEMAYELQILAEKDKKVLTDKGSVKRSIKYDGEKASIELTREKFDVLTADLLDQTFVLTDKVLETAKEKGITKIDAFLLVGGSTRMKQIEAGVIERYGQTLGIMPEAFDVDECVAKGAAQAGEIFRLKGRVDDEIEKRTQGKDFKSLPSVEQEKITQEAIAEVAANEGILPETANTAYQTKITTVASKSYGVVAINASGERAVFNLIIKQAEVPVKKSDEFQTLTPNATELLLEVFVNNESKEEVHLGSQDEKLGEAVFRLDGNLPAGSPIEIIFELDEYGILKLTGIDKTYNKTIVAEFKSRFIETKEEKEEAKKKQDLVKVSG